jgi:hypothetical protein
VVTPVTLPPGRLRLGHETERDRIAAGREDNGNRHGCRLCKANRRSAGGGNHVDPTTNQVGRQFRQSIVAMRPAVFDRAVLVLDVTHFAQTLAKCGYKESISPGATCRSGSRSPASPAAAPAQKAARRLVAPPSRWMNARRLIL